MDASASPSGQHASPFFIAVIVLGLCIAGASVLWPQVFVQQVATISGWFKFHAGHAVLLGGGMVLLLNCLLIFSPWGNKRLGGEEAKPEFHYISWVCMLFAAGMGAGLVFWGVAEPLMHKQYLGEVGIVPLDADVIARTNQLPLVLTYFHWALHPWAVYGLSALVMALVVMHHDKPMLMSSPLTLIRHHPWLLAIADMLAALAVWFGIAGALSLGVLQLDAGLAQLSDAYEPKQATSWLGIIALLTICYSWSIVMGLKRGIKWLSYVNMVLAVMLAGYVAYYQDGLLRRLLISVSEYSELLPELSIGWVGKTEPGGWSESWSVTHLLAWVAWIPFVGAFIARISYGRTVRQLLMGVMLVPSLLSMVWFSIFGGSALDAVHGTMPELMTLVQQDVSVALFAFLKTLPFADYVTLLVVMLLFFFLVTSADSAALVLAMMTSAGNDSPPVKRQLIWGVLIALLMTGTVLSGEGVQSVRAVFGFGAIPLCFLLLLQLIALLREKQRRLSQN